MVGYRAGQLAAERNALNALIKVIAPTLCAAVWPHRIDPSPRNVRVAPAASSPQNIRLAPTASPRDPSPRNIRSAPAASPRPVSAEDPLGKRGVCRRPPRRYAFLFTFGSARGNVGLPFFVTSSLLAASALLAATIVFEEEDSPR